ncbi:hypothetical protein GQ43DRAFT_107085 [Delitschia confertaspora ATCC 74209]|uniref:Uncharacterized protein n=1 Tax=Delitschia confertaspora ATCC 74209 TaxID=1513339 RepID=A0A9P4MNM5_9PLEO|nr:hypothetical protein GQ43DRAFT_107085 [Delitschia confertaspora ATCC 74209]
MGGSDAGGVCVTIDDGSNLFVVFNQMRLSCKCTRFLGGSGDGSGDGSGHPAWRYCYSVLMWEGWAEASILQFSLVVKVNPDGQRHMPPKPLSFVLLLFTMQRNATLSPTQLVGRAEKLLGYAMPKHTPPSEHSLIQQQALLHVPSLKPITPTATLQPQKDSYSQSALDTVQHPEFRRGRLKI